MSITETFARAEKLTEWPPYQAEATNIREGTEGWKPADHLLRMTLCSVSDIRKALDESKKCFSDRLFTFIDKRPSLVELRCSYMKMGAHDIRLSYQLDIDGAKEAVLRARKEVKTYKREVKKSFESPEKTLTSAEERATLAFETAVTLLAELQKKTLKHHEEILNHPFSKDIRCKKKVIRELDRDFMAPDGHQKYEAILEQYFKDGQCFRENSQEECWRWKGQELGMRTFKSKIAHTTHSLFKAAICLKSLEEHKNDPYFFKVSENHKREKQEKRQKEGEKMMAERVGLYFFSRGIPFFEDFSFVEALQDMDVNGDVDSSSDEVLPDDQTYPLHRPRSSSLPNLPKALPHL